MELTYISNKFDPLPEYRKAVVEFRKWLEVGMRIRLENNQQFQDPEQVRSYFDEYNSILENFTNVIPEITKEARVLAKKINT